MSPRITLLAVALSICLPLQAATEVIQLNNRMGEEVLPVAESVLGGQGRVTAYGNQLIVNAPDALIRELRQVVDQLDVAPKRLLISVDTQDSANSTAGGYRVDGSARAGDVEFETGRGEIGGRDQVRDHSSQYQQPGRWHSADPGQRGLSGTDSGWPECSADDSGQRWLWPDLSANPVS